MSEALERWDLGMDVINMGLGSAVTFLIALTLKGNTSVVIPREKKDDVYQNSCSDAHSTGGAVVWDQYGSYDLKWVLESNIDGEYPNLWKNTTEMKACSIIPYWNQQGKGDISKYYTSIPGYCANQSYNWVYVNQAIGGNQFCWETSNGEANETIKVVAYDEVIFTTVRVTGYSINLQVNLIPLGSDLAATNPKRLLNLVAWEYDNILRVWNEQSFVCETRVGGIGTRDTQILYLSIIIVVTMTIQCLIKVISFCRSNKGKDDGSVRPLEKTTELTTKNALA